MFSLGKLIEISFVLAITSAIFLAAAQAATITVTNAGDVSGNDQACTLREAINSIHALNTNSTGCIHSGLYGVADTIEFHHLLSNQVIVLDQDLALSITIDLVINGLGADQLTIDGSANAPGGIFSIESRFITVDINNLTISRGRTDGFGGGIYAEGILNLTDCIVSRNIARSGGGIMAYGGSRVTLSNTIVSGNSADEKGGGIMVDSEARVTINNSLITENSATTAGGGISIDSDSNTTITSSTVSDNTAGTDGGGINIFGTSSDTSVLVRTSTISGNTAQEQGGGINGFLLSLAIRSSTISGNIAHVGGGVFFGSDDADKVMTITESSFVKNWANDDGGAIIVAVANGAVAKFYGSIFSGNQAVDLADEIGSVFGGPIEANAANLFGDSLNSTAQAFSGFTPDPLGTDIVATSDGSIPTALSSILNPTLQNNGGPTQTHALVTGSPAIDSGRGFCSADQRGEARTDGECDIGSYEYFPLIFLDSFE